MLLTSMNAAPVLAARRTCHHGISNETVTYLGTSGGKDRFKYKRTCLKCYYSETYYGQHPHCYSVKYEKLVASNKDYETYNIYNRCTRYSNCHAEKYVTRTTKKHTWNSRRSGNYTVYTCKKFGFVKTTKKNKIRTMIKLNRREWICNFPLSSVRICKFVTHDKI